MKASKKLQKQFADFKTEFNHIRLAFGDVHNWKRGAIVKSFHHTPVSAAKAIRAGYESGRLGKLAKTWADYWQQQAEHRRGTTGGIWANAYTAALLVQEQCNGAGKREPVTFKQASEAVADILPELFGEYWDAMPLRGQI